MEKQKKNVDFTYQGCGDTLSDIITIGDNFIVNPEKNNSEVVDFYILKCTVCKKCAMQNIVDAWGNFVYVGIFYIEDIFYARLDYYDYVHKLLEDKPVAYMYTYLVKCINVSMSQYNSYSDLYTISATLYECIYNNML